MSQSDYSPVATGEPGGLPESESYGATPPTYGGPYSTEGHDGPEEWPPKRSMCYLLGLNAFVFAYGILVATFGLITLPSESERMVPEAQAVVLAVSTLAISLVLPPFHHSPPPPIVTLDRI